ncbi:hypothetical protein H1230_25180 [Paenibacillus sp. 19GGS1-52]|uniref:hypothetical protein n=1 Tax=Paenibacillus sp. 19GGS1-52 TaxID=2758563 RepID=UPI001EFBF730|nr:hypothetical protein [Paenibacillus sp. 19GGS1-52]ULO06283.1 hypothetical protein H1230_25180 [Paenibacillus sp. 19GGS1-52]
MRKMLSLIVSCTLLLSLSAPMVSAEEGVSQAGNISSGSEVPQAFLLLEDQPTETTVPTVPTATTTSNPALNDISMRTVTEGVYVDIYYQGEDNLGSGSTLFVPEFTLELWSVKDNKKISSVSGSTENYNVSKQKYELLFKHPGYKLGDELAFILREASPLLKSITFTTLVRQETASSRTEYNLTLNSHFKFLVEAFDYFGGANDEQQFRDLTGTSLRPISGVLKVNNKKIGLQLQDESNNMLKNTKLTIKLQEGKGTFDLTTDDKGIAWVETDKLTWKFLVGIDGRTVVNGVNNKAEIELPTDIVAGNSKTLHKILITVENIHSVGTVAVDFSTASNSSLSNNWSGVNVLLTDAVGKSHTYFVSMDDRIIPGVTDGIYKVSVAGGKYSVGEPTASSITVKNGVGKLEVSLTPKYLFNVSKGGQSYNFSVLNVASIADKEFKGKATVSFAVKPNESYMLRDNETGKVFSVLIDDKSPVTTLVLGAGVVMGGSSTNPHTGDSIIYMIAAFLLSMGLATWSVFALRKPRRNSTVKSSVMIILLTLSTVTSILLPVGGDGVSAADTSDANVGGTPPATSSSSSTTAAGTFQTSDNVAVLQFGFIPNKMSSSRIGVLSSTSSKVDLQDDFKFDYENLMFYMAPNKTSDALFRKSSSGLITFERNGSSSKVKALYGENPLYPNSSTGSPHEQLLRRTLDYADNAISDGGNLFKQIIGESLYNIDPNDPNRNLAGDGNVQVVGDSIKDMIEDYILKHGSEDNFDKIDAQIIGSMMFDGYMDLIKEKGVLTGKAYSNFEQMMQEKFDKDELVLFFQTVVGISVKDNNSSYDRDYAFMPMHDATDWYLWIRQTARPTDDTLAQLSANREFEAVTKGGASSSEQAYLSPYKENGNLPNTFQMYARDNYTRTLKPVTTKVPLSSTVSINPFGSWGYQPWGYGSGEKVNGNKPEIDINLNVTVVDARGIATGKSFTKAVSGWTEESQKYLGQISAGDKVVKGSMSLEHEGKLYEVLEDKNAKFTLQDKRDQENINKSTLIKSEAGKNGSIAIPAIVNGDTWEIELGFDTPLPVKLHQYLGGDGKSDSSVENKYAGVKDNGKGVYSNARLTLYVKATKDSPEPITTEYIVPQWRLSKYWDTMNPAGSDQARFSISLPSSTFSDPQITPSGMTIFSLVNPDLGAINWATSTAKLVNDTVTKEITAYRPTNFFNLTGDLLAIRDNESVSNIKIAEWVNNFSLFNGHIAAASRGAVEEQAQVIKSNIFKYGVKSPFTSYQYSETRYKMVKEYDKNGKLTGSHSEPYRWSSPAPVSYQSADYKTTVNFQRYIPKDGAAEKSFAEDSASTNGLYWSTHPEESTLKVNPEVLMAFDDESGNTSVAFVAGDRLRSIQPISYNQAEFVNVNIQPAISGMSVATDANAKKLANSLGAAGKEVIYKGSSVTTNFKVAGELELKTFALDIGSTALKNAWNPGLGYSTDKINESFLSQYADKNASTGKWQVVFDAQGKLVINNKDYGGQSTKLPVTEISNLIAEHTLLIRGGKLVSVDGITNLNSLSAELKQALTQMKILGDKNIFGAFEHGSGSNLTESVVANLGNALRGTNDLAIGRGFYNEDVTTLIVREYINRFKLPQFAAVDKIPLEIPGLAADVNKNQFFSKGLTGHSKLILKVNDAEMIFDSSKGDFGGKRSIEFVVGNVSVLDSFQR